MTPWYVQRPELLKSELARLQVRYPEFTVQKQALEAGRVVLFGTVRQACEAGVLSHHLLLRFPFEYPYLPPEVIPLVSIPKADGGSARGEPDAAEIRFDSARHQMATGALCLFESQADPEARQWVTGVDALERAEAWLRWTRRATFPRTKDTVRAELEEHYHRSGDIVLGPTAFAPDLPQEGHLIAFDLRDESYPLFVVTHLETSAGWKGDLAPLQHLRDDIVDESLPNLAHPITIEQIEKARVSKNWLVAEYRCSQLEPPPFRSLGDFLSWLYNEPAGNAPERFLQEHELQRLTASAVVYALRFPSRNGTDYEWLVMRVQLREKTLETEYVPGVGASGHVLDLVSDSEKLLRDGHLTILRVQDLRRPAFEIRNQGRIPSTSANFVFSLLGAGALGSACADLLSKAGVKAIDIWDPDLLDAGNVIRHTVGLRSVGLPKANLVAVKCKSHNPFCEVRAFPRSALLAPVEEVDPWTSRCTLSVIANDAVELAINRQAISGGTTVYYLRALRAGDTARMVRVKPGLDACLECLVHYSHEGDSRFPRVPPAPGEVIRRECGSPVLAASAADLAIVAGLGVRCLLEDSASGGEQNHWVWSISGIEGHPTLGTAFSMVRSFLPPHPHCQVCGSSPLTRLQVPRAFIEKMIALARRKHPKETGGILIGRRSATEVEVVEASDEGPMAESTPTHFIRDGKYCQKYLEDVVRSLGEGVDYVGEWHSHPNGSSGPSPRDIISLNEIAEDPDFLTDCPVMMIIGFAAGAEKDPEIGGSCHPEGAPGRALEIVIRNES